MVGYDGWDIYVTMHGNILDLSDTLSGVGVSDSGSVVIALRHGVGQCGEVATGVLRLDRTILLLLGTMERGKSGNKGPSGRDPLPGPNNVPPTVRREPQVVPPRGPPGAGVGTPPPAASEDLLRALKLLQAVMSVEDFSKYEKVVLRHPREERTKEREQLLWEMVQSQNRLRKQEAGHVEQIAKLEADAA